MRKYFHSKAVIISDDELEMICWLSEMVRNNLTHFIPKSYAIGIIDIIETAKIILRITHSLVFESNQILFIDYERSQKRIKNALDEMQLMLQKEEVRLKTSTSDENQDGLVGE